MRMNATSGARHGVRVVLDLEAGLGSGHHAQLEAFHVSLQPRRKATRDPAVLESGRRHHDHLPLDSSQRPSPGISDSCRAVTNCCVADMTVVPRLDE